jgi:allantoate deiminase
MSIESVADTARTVLERCTLLGTFSEEADRLTRPSLTGSMRKVDETVARWMRESGMWVEQDAIGNIFGRYQSHKDGQVGAKTLLLGSHLDSVRDAGRYDGPLGVLIALACVERLRQRGQRLPFAIEVIGFTDEEGLRFHSAYMGSKWASGQFSSETLARRDNNGVTVTDAIKSYNNMSDAESAQQLPKSRWRSEELLGYCEVHIEQGPVLEADGLPIGVVQAIVGQSRMQLDFVGEAGHAGTVPMVLRHDALCGAAEFVLAAERLAREIPGLVATMGEIEVRPGASNVIPGHVQLSLDVRHQEDSIRLEACQKLREQLEEICEQRQLAYQWHVLLDHPATRCDTQLMDGLEQTISTLGYPVRRLDSGAGHDAVIMSALTRIAMLFVRCKGGVSHNPAESVTVEDVSVAIDVLEHFLLLMSQESTL